MPKRTEAAGPVISRHKLTLVHRYGDELRTDELVLRPVHMVVAERHFSGTVPGVEGMLYAAHYALTHERKLELAPFNIWLDEHLEAIDEESTDPLEAPPATQ